MDEHPGKCVGDPDHDPAADLGSDGCVADLDLSPVGTPTIHAFEVSAPEQFKTRAATWEQRSDGSSARQIGPGNMFPALAFFCD